MAKQSDAQKETVARVMHEFKHGELRIGGNGPKVRNPKQAVAIGLHEAGATNTEPPAKNRRNLRETKRKERHSDTAQAAAEGRSGETKAALYAEAKRRDIPGRSGMSKGELEKALHRA